MKPIRLAVRLMVICGAAADARPADWPMWRHDAERSAETDEKLPAELHLQWVRQYPKLKPAWPQQVAKGFMTFDVSYKPIVMGKRLYVGSSLNHRLTALDTATGDEVWRFYAGGQGLLHRRAFGRGDRAGQAPQHGRLGQVGHVRLRRPNRQAALEG